ncbi:MAG TPA: ABC transporter permease [Bryobacteraceae bacterium]|jgi:predicted permease|nr:ABC transporter permease [Bryobacteraceae bacterium]
MIRDLKYAWRTLRRSPIFLLTAVATLGLGIGATTAIFSLFYQVLLRQLPVRAPQQLYVLHRTGSSMPGWSSSDNAEPPLSYPLYRSLRDGSSAVSQGMIARSIGFVDIQHNGNTERAQTEIVSGNFFDVLGVKPFAGRLLSPADDTVRRGNHVAVLGYAFWSQKYGGANMIGQSVLVNNDAMTIVGIVSPGFRSLLSGQTPDIYLPISMAGLALPGFNGFDDPSAHWLTIVSRLRSGVSRARAQAALNPLFTSALRDEIGFLHITSQHSRDRILGNRLELYPASSALNALENSWKRPLNVLMTAAGVLLLIGCSNLAGLLLVRASARRGEIALRKSVGATRWQIVSQLLCESVLLALLGGVLGLLLSLTLTSGILRMVPPDVTAGWVGSRFDWAVFGFTVSVSFAAGLVFGILPAWHVSSEPASVLREQSHRAASGAGQTRLRRLLVTCEIALCVVLLAGAGLFLKSLTKLLHHNPGFHPENLLSFTLDPGLGQYDAARALTLYNQLQQRLSESPGVAAASFCQFGPYSNSDSSTNISIEGYQPTEDENMDSRVNLAAPGLFHTLGISVIAGREFTFADGPDSPKVVIVNQAFVKRFVRGRDAIGMYMSPGGGKNLKLDRQIVGVIADAQFASLRRDAVPFYFLPFSQARKPADTAPQAVFLVRTRNAGPSLFAAVRRMVSSLDRTLPVTNMSSMEILIQNSVFQDRAVATLTTASSLLALLLASLGLYGVVAYNVSRRTAEIGIRMALGADRYAVVALVLREVLWMVLTGAAAGIFAGLALTRAIASQLFGVEPADVTIFATAVTAVVLVALIAGAAPTLRAARIDPMRALRYD